MKKEQITTIVILLIVVLGAWFLYSYGKNKNPEVPATVPETSTDTAATSNPAQISVTAPTSVSEVKPGEAPVIKVKEFTVIGKNFSFTPSTITVKKGDTVRIDFENDNGMHNLKIDEFNVGTKTIPGGTVDSIQFVADKAGTFQYYCSVGNHRAMGMWGTLVVQ